MHLARRLDICGLHDGQATEWTNLAELGTFLASRSWSSPTQGRPWELADENGRNSEPWVPLHCQRNALTEARAWRVVT